MGAQVTGTSLSRIGRYEIRRELGRGTMGIVYLAEDPALDRSIALKTIDLAFAVPAPERAGFEQRFLAEGRVAGRLSHPGIVVVHDVGRDENTGILYIALEYLEGRTLAEALQEGEPMPWREALRVTAGLARALHHAHTHGIVHRDMKPANIMILASGEPKIMDFGIAKAPHIELTSAGQLFGTPLYMSPEQALGQPLDGRSDLFSLGSIAYTMLTGKQAFRADNVFQVLARVTQEHPAPPSHENPSVPADVDVFMKRVLAKSPAERYQDGNAMARDAEELLEGRPLATWSLKPAEEAEHPLAELVEDTLRSSPLPAPPASRWRWEPFAAALALAIGVAVLVAAFRKELPIAPPAGTVAEPAPRADGPGASGAPSAPVTPAPPPSAPAAPMSRLQVDFAHHLKSGRLRVWVDEDLVLEDELDSRVTKKILSLRVRKGMVDETLEVPAGRRQVKVQVRWDDNIKTGTISGTFKANRTRRLEIRVSRVLGGLSLRWK
jgi:serine/threonine-protein kinase